MGHNHFRKGDAVRTSNGRVGIVREVTRENHVKLCRVGILATQLSHGIVRHVVDHEELHTMDSLTRGY